MIKLFFIFMLSFFTTPSLAASEYSTILSQDVINILNQSQNLTSMMKQFNNSDTEWDAINSVSSLAGSVTDYLGFMSDFLYLQNNMVDSRDRQTVSKLVKTNQKHYVKGCESNLQTINISLVYIKNGAVINQAMIVRDLVSKGCEDLRKF